MSFETITIFRHWPVINGFVQVPHNTEADKSRVTVDEALANITDSEEIILSQGSGAPTGSGFGAQNFIRLPGLNGRVASLATDPVDDVASS